MEITQQGQQETRGSTSLTTRAEGGAKYLQVLENMRRNIVTGGMAGRKIMSVRMLAKTLGIDAKTAGKVYAELEKEGLIKCRGAKGTFVTGDSSRIERARQKLIRRYTERFGEEIKGLTCADGSSVSLEEIMKILKETMKEKREVSRE